MEEELKKSRDELEMRVKERTADLFQVNERLKEDEQMLRLEQKRLDALLQLSQMEGATLKEITGFTLEQAIALTNSKIGFVGFLNEDETVYTLHAVSKDVVKECRVTGDPVQWHVVDAGIWADAIKDNRTLFVNDYSKPHPRKKDFLPDILILGSSWWCLSLRGKESWLSRGSATKPQTMRNPMSSR